MEKLNFKFYNKKDLIKHFQNKRNEKYANEEYVTHKVEEHAYIFFRERNFAQLFRIESRQTNKIIIKKTHKKAFQTKKHQQFNFNKYELKLNNFYVFF